MEANQIVVFQLEGHDFGIDIKKVLEILNYESTRPVPEAPSYIDGILNVRGVVYTIFNLRKRLSMPDLEDKHSWKIILLHLDKYKVGLLVDSVAEILNVDETKVECSPEMLNKKRTSCIQEIVKQEDHMVIVLDVNVLISDEEKLFVQGVSDENNCSSDTKQGESERNKGNA